jgi:hypothetical protein
MSVSEHSQAHVPDFSAWRQAMPIPRKPKEKSNPVPEDNSKSPSGGDKIKIVNPCAIWTLPKDSSIEEIEEYYDKLPRDYPYDPAAPHDFNDDDQTVVRKLIEHVLPGINNGAYNRLKSTADPKMQCNDVPIRADQPDEELPPKLTELPDAQLEAPGKPASAYEASTK